MGFALRELAETCRPCMQKGLSSWEDWRRSNRASRARYER